jgi:hypothetical protein
MNTIISPEAKKAINVGRAEHWRFRVTQKKPEWVYEEVDETNIGLDRIKALRAAGVGIKGVAIGNEAPKLVPAPKVEPRVEPKPDFKNTSQIVPDMSGFFEVLFLGVGLMFQLLFQLMVLDPALIVVLDDGTWLEVATWAH